MQRIGFVCSPGFQLMAFAASSVFEFANFASGRPIYDVRFVSEQGGCVKSSIGVAVATEPFGDPAFDTVIVAGGNGVRTPSPRLVAFVREASATSRRIGSICTGAFVLAEAGVLDGRRATTHWQSARDLQALYPKVKMDEDRIFIVDGPVWTSAGMSAGVDLALGMIEKDHSADLARTVAKQLVVSHRRAGGQAQYSALLELDPKSDRIQSALLYARENLRSPLSVELLADAARLSPRQFSRAFRAETGQSPAKAIEHLRVEAARLMLEQGRHSIDVVAAETGFADPDRMRRAFLRAFGQPPQVLRRNARIEAAA